MVFADLGWVRNGAVLKCNVLADTVKALWL